VTGAKGGRTIDVTEPEKEAPAVTEPEGLSEEQEEAQRAYGRSFEAQRRAAKDATFMSTLRKKLALLDRKGSAGSKRLGA
jgi:hypothetical protein